MKASEVIEMRKAHVCTKLSSKSIFKYVSTPKATICVLNGAGCLMYFATLWPAGKGRGLNLKDILCSDEALKI